MYQLKVESGYGYYSKVSEHEEFIEAYEEMCKRFDAGEEEDFLIKNSGDKDMFGTVYQAYQLHAEPCPECCKPVRHIDLMRTYDCHGIPFRHVCPKCYERIMDSKKGYDGEYYDEWDECIENDY